MAKATVVIVASGLLSVAAIADTRLSGLERHQQDAFIGGMATAEQRVPKGTCLRFFACIGDADPSPGLKQSIHQAGYGAVRWCSERSRAVVPARCKATVVRVHEPVIMPATRLEFSVEGPISVRCRVLFDAGMATSAKHCEPITGAKAP